MQRCALALTYVAVLAMAAAANAQTDACLRRTVPISILAPAGAVVAPNDVTVSINKKPVKVLAITADLSPHRVLILLDASGSVTGPPGLWPTHLALATNLVANLPPGDLAGIASFANDFKILTPFTDDKKVLHQALTDQQPLPNQPAAATAALPTTLGPIGKGTSLYDSLVKAADLMAPPRGGDLIYVFTDGDDDASLLPAQDAQKLLGAKGIRVDSVLIAKNRNPAERSQRYKFQELTAKMRGTGIVISGHELQQEAPLVDQDGKATARGNVWLELFQLSPLLAAIQIELTAQLKANKQSVLALRGPGPKDIQIEYRVNLNLQPCSAQADGSSPRP